MVLGLIHVCVNICMLTGVGTTNADAGQQEDDESTPTSCLRVFITMQGDQASRAFPIEEWLHFLLKNGFISY